MKNISKFFLIFGVLLFVTCSSFTVTANADLAIDALHDAVYNNATYNTAFINMYGVTPIEPKTQAYGELLGYIVYPSAPATYPGLTVYLQYLVDSHELDQAIQSLSVAEKTSLYTIYGINVPSQAHESNSYVGFLFGQVSSPWYNSPTDFVNNVIAANDLVQELRADSGRGITAATNVLNVTITSSGPLTSDQIGSIFNLMFDTSGQTQAYTDPVGYVEAVISADDLLTALRANSGEGCDNLWTLTGIGFSKSGQLTGWEIGQLYGLMYDATGSETLAYTDPTAYVEGVNHAVDLLNELRSGGGIGIGYISDVYGQVIPSTGHLSGSEIEFLYHIMYKNGTETTLAYTDAAAFVALLSDVLALDAALEANNLKGDIQVLFGIVEAQQDPAVNSVYRTLLFDLVGDTSFDQAAFLLGLPAAASLHLALDSKRAEFETEYGIAIADQDPVTNAAYRTKLFDIVGDPAYDETAFIANLGGVPGLDSVLSGVRVEFAALFGIPVAEQILSNPVYTGVLSDLAYSPGFDAGVFVNLLPLAYDLHQDLLVAPVPQQTAYQNIYGVTNMGNKLGTGLARVRK